MSRRVVLLSDLYAPVVGGLEGHVQGLGRALAKRGHSVAVVTQTHPDAPASEEVDGVAIRRVDGWSRVLRRFYQDPAYRFVPPVPDPGMARAIAGVLEERRAEIVHAHSWILYSALATPTRRGRALVMTLHDYGLACARKTLVQAGGARCSGPSLGKCLRCAPEQYGIGPGSALVTGLLASRPLHRRVDRFLAVSSSVRDRVGDVAGGRPIEVVPNFLAANVTEGPTGERPEFLPVADGYLLYVGELSRHKGVDILLAAYRRLVDAPPLVLIGRRVPDFDPTGVHGVIVVPGAPRQEVIAAFRSASIALVPSVWDEPCPTVAIEAMACGKPVVASAVGGLPDIVVDGETGMLVPPGDDAALAGAISGLLADPSHLAELGERGRERSVQFSEASVVRRVVDVYEDILERRTRG